MTSLFLVCLKLSKCYWSSYVFYHYLPYRSKSRETESTDPVSDKKKIKEEKEKEEEKVEDVS